MANTPSKDRVAAFDSVYTNGGMADYSAAGRMATGRPPYSTKPIFQVSPRHAPSLERPNPHHLPLYGVQRQLVDQRIKARESVTDDLPSSRPNHVSTSPTSINRSALCKIHENYDKIITTLEYVFEHLHNCRHPALVRSVDVLRTDINSVIEDFYDLLSELDQARGDRWTVLRHKIGDIFRSLRSYFIEDIEKLQHRCVDLKDHEDEFRESVLEHDQDLIEHVLRVLRHLWVPKKATAPASEESRRAPSAMIQRLSRKSGPGQRDVNFSTKHEPSASKAPQLVIDLCEDDNPMDRVSTKPAPPRRKSGMRFVNMMPTSFKRKRHEHSASLVPSQMQSSQHSFRNSRKWDKRIRTYERLPSPTAGSSGYKTDLPLSPPPENIDADADSGISTQSEDYDAKDQCEKSVVAANVLRAMGQHPIRAPLNHALEELLRSNSVSVNGRGKKCLAVIQDKMVSKAREYWDNY